MKKELYLGGEKSTKEYYPKDFGIYFKQLLKKIFKSRGKK
jgi:hypothetical protein